MTLLVRPKMPVSGHRSPAKESCPIVGSLYFCDFAIPVKLIMLGTKKILNAVQIHRNQSRWNIIRLLAEFVFQDFEPLAVLFTRDATNIGRIGKQYPELGVGNKIQVSNEIIKVASNLRPRRNPVESPKKMLDSLFFDPGFK